MDKDMLKEALARFGHANFREGQCEPIEAVLRGEDAVVVMPTGAGKSLCYQVTALMLPGTTLVVSPLIALMKDQVDALERKGVSVTLINSTVGCGETEKRLKGMADGEYKLVYVVDGANPDAETGLKVWKMFAGYGNRIVEFDSATFARALGIKNGIAVATAANVLLNAGFLIRSEESRFMFQLTDLETKELIADCESIRITKAFVVMRRALTARDTGAVESYERFCYTLDLKEKWICRR